MRNLFYISIISLLSHLSLQGQPYSNIAYQSLYTSSTFSRTIDTTLPVGATAGGAEVSLTGGSNYTIPVIIPPGTNGMVPSLSIAYNSQSGDGQMGMGWGISGLSAITRERKDFYHDNEVKPVTIDNSDPFALDGNRLVAITGTYGADNTIYYTKNETFARITSFGDMGAGCPYWFKVETKSGITYEYGNSSDSRFMQDNSGTKAMQWALNKAYDCFGNYIEYKYKSDERDFRVDEINYTGNASAVPALTPYNKIKFTYGYRTDKTTTYVDGNALNSNFLLTKITITAEGSTAFKEYEFTYGLNGSQSHSFLRQVTEVGDNATKLNSTMFQYGGEPNSYSFTNANVTESTYNQFISGDFNSDGNSDILALHDTMIGSLHYHDKYKIYTKNINGTSFTNTDTKALPVDFEVINKVKVPSFFSFMVDDYHGDGTDDILLTRKIVSSTNRKLDLVRINTYQNGTQLGTWDYPVTGTFQVVHPYGNNGNYIFSGDFDGDSRGDYVTILSNSTGYKAFISFPHNSTKKEITPSTIGPGNYPATEWAISDFIYVMDYDGDGKTELMVVRESYTYIYTFKNFGNTTIDAENLYTAGYPTKWHEIRLGDFNGDGRTDLLTKTQTNVFQTAISKGLGNSFVASTFTFNSSATSNNSKIILTDADGDGRTDVVHGFNTGSTTCAFDVYYSQGNTFYRVQSSFTNTIPSSEYPMSGDFNGDGRQDLILRKTKNDPIHVLAFKPLGTDHVLERIANGFNHLTRFTYDRLSTGSPFHVKGGPTSYPNNNVQPALYAVASMIVSTGNGSANTSTTNYTYEEARMNRQGRGFLGFKKVNATNSTINRKTTTEFSINSTWQSPYVLKETERLSSNNALVNETTNTVSFNAVSNNRYWQRTDQVVVLDNVQSNTHTTSYTYDANGNVTGETLNMDGEETVSTTHSSFGSYCTWIPAKPTQTTVTKTRTGLTAHNRVINRTFNTNGSLATETDFHGQSKAVTTSYLYNQFGNATSSSISASGQTARTTTYGYDSKGRFATTVTNPLSQTATIAYSAKWGKPTSQTSISNTTTSFTYDAFGRQSSTVTPESNTINTNYYWDVQGSNSIGGTTIVFRTEDLIPGKPDVKTWYDMLGRERKQEKEGYAANSWIITYKTYDNRGNIATASAPYYSGSSGVGTTYNYDDYNRQISAVNSAGTTSTSYNIISGQYKVTTTAPDATTTSQATDASGKVVSATDNGGTLNYEYNSFGNQTKVKNGTTTLVTMEYDNYGRQTSLADTDAGTTTYDYNAFGELASQTDANGNAYTMTYDVLGRITSRVGPASEGTTTYEYVTVNNGKNLIKKVTGFNGILQEYTYDAYSRMLTDKQTVDGTAHTTTYAYNNFGDVTSVTYPSSFAINNTYNAKGFLTYIANGGNTITLFHSPSFNAYGQLTGYTLGNGIASTRSFDIYGFPTNFTATGKQNLNMSFNVQNGNLSSRNDVIKSRTETFLYDNLDRLTSATVTGQSANTVTYTAAGVSTGNIATKTSVGTYSYASNQIHAVASITNPNGTVPTGTQNITYTAYHQPNTITEGINEVNFTYGPDYERRKMLIKQNGTVQSTRFYFGNGYEKIEAGGTTTHLHYISCGAGLISIVTKVGTTDTYNYVYTDHLGSILTVTSATGTVLAEQNFDAWGRPRNPNDWTFANVPTPPTWLIRGYTGHEHLHQFNLINMNGRVYDPILGRMLSVDNYVQSPHSTQNFNRFAYVMNNPLKYKDPNGEFILGALINGVAGAIRGDGFFPSVGQYFENKFNIITGLFNTDSGRKPLGRVLELVSRFTWQLPQTALGFGLANIMNEFSLVNDVRYFRGATVLDSRFDGGAFTLSNFIFAERGTAIRIQNRLLTHEYGHYLQSQRLGPLYMSFVAYPSLVDFYAVDELFGQDLHGFRWYEAGASRLAANYFDGDAGFNRTAFERINPTDNEFHWSDIFINLPLNGGLGLFRYLF